MEFRRVVGDWCDIMRKELIRQSIMRYGDLSVDIDAKVDKIVWGHHVSVRNVIREEMF
jgi:hypothetical protein